MPPPKKSGGMGKVILILVGLFLLLGAIGVAGVLFFASRSSGLEVSADNSEVLKAQVQKLYDAVGSGDSKQVEEPLLQLAVLPDHARAWFNETFGPQLGPRLYEEWERDVFKELPSMIKPFKEARQSGKSEIRVSRVNSITDTERKSHQAVVKKRTKPNPLYVVTFTEPGSSFGDDVFFYSVVNGRMGYVGPMVRAW